MQSSSRALGRGALGGNISTNSLEGRFLSNLERDILSELPNATVAQRLLVVDYCRRAWAIRQLFPVVAANPDDAAAQRRYDKLQSEQNIAHQRLFHKTLPSPTASRRPKPSAPRSGPLSLNEIIAGMP